MGYGSIYEKIHNFIESELERHESRRFELEFEPITGPVEEYNRVFRFALKLIWGKGIP